MTYVARLADSELAAAISEHPAVLITGPRATGKTTSGLALARTSLSLVDPAVRAAVSADPMNALVGRAEPILVDEWQQVPETLNAIKALVDAEPRRGRFVVTGSVRGDLDAQTWPGTGRLVRVPMYGLIEREVEGRTSAPGWLDEMLAGRVPDPVRTPLAVRDYVHLALRSGFPEPALELGDRGRRRWLRSYVEQLVTRDADGIDGGRDPERLHRYLSAVALNSAGIVDDVTLYEAARISKVTAKAYERLLTNLLIVEQLPAWTPNALKRLSLAPKRYLVDAGLFVGVLGVTEEDVLTDGGLMGRVIDTFVTSQLRAELALRFGPRTMFHLRTSGGRAEVDLVIEVGYQRVIAIEVKASSAPTERDARHLRWFANQFGDIVQSLVLFHTGPEQFLMEGGVIAAPIASLWS